MRTEATLAGLDPVATYRVQVRAVNDAGAGPWSASGSGRTEGQAGPRGLSLLRLVGNLEQGIDITSSAALQAHDWAQGFTTAPHSFGWVVDRVDLELEEVIAGSSVQVTLATGASTTGAGTTVATLRSPATLQRYTTSSFTAPAGTVLEPDTEYFVVVEGAYTTLNLTASNAEDGLRDWYVSDNGLRRARSSTGAWTGQGSKLKFRVSGREAVGEAPGAPDAPVLAALPDSTGVSASWFAPDHVGSGITYYDLRYYAGSADPADEAGWVTVDETTGLPRALNSTAWIIAGLSANTGYRVQVRAVSHGAPGPWSESASVTTSTPTGANGAPTLAKLGTAAEGCIAAEPGPLLALSAWNGTLVSWNRKLTDTSDCTGSSREAPLFIDPDGDPLTVTAIVPEIPGNVRFINGTPSIHSDRLFFMVAAAGGQTDVQVIMRVTDPHGQSVDRVFLARAFPGRSPNTSAPRFDEMVGVRGFPRNKPIPRWVLPPATGGDMVSRNTTGQLPYFYRVSGLPPGLSFDPLTRTVTGTPTQDGAYTVTYIADDADAAYSRKDSPSAADLADVARQSFVVRIGAPAIELVQMASAPTYDSDGDGSFDTYIAGDTIMVDVQFTEAVEVTGTPATAGARPRLRLDLGDDDGNPGNSRKTADLLEAGGELYAGRRLRFGYTVEGGNGEACTSATTTADCDPDGVWVQTVGTNRQVVILPTGLGLASADSGARAALTFQGLPTTGSANAKVDGSVTSASIGPRPVSAETDADGDTITVTFNRELNTQTDVSGGLPFGAYFSVRGAGPVGAGQRGVYQHPRTVTVSGATLMLELNTPARAGDAVTLTYENAGGGAWPLKDTLSPPKRAAGFVDLAVTNNSTKVVAPVPLRASVVGTALALVFDRRLDQDSRPAGSAFTVAATDRDGVNRTIAGTAAAVTVDDATVTVALAGAVTEHDTLSVSYAKPAASALAAAAGTPAVASFDGFHVEGVHDSTAPMLVGDAAQKSRSADLSASPPESAQSKVALYYDEPLDEGSRPSTTSFAVTVGTAGAVHPDKVEITGSAVVLTLDQDIAANTQVVVSYTALTNPIRDLARNDAADFARTVTAVDPAQPVVDSGYVNGSLLVLRYDHPLDPASVPGPGQFTLHLPRLAGQTVLDPYPAASVAAVEIREDAVFLRLSAPVHPCEGASADGVVSPPFTVTYTRQGSESGIRGLDGWGAAAFADRDVINNARLKCVGGVFDAYFGSVVLVGKRPFDTTADPDPAWFAVTASGGPVRVTGAAFDPDDPLLLRLEVSRDFAPDETVTVSYERPTGERGLWDVDGNQLEDVADLAVRAGPDGARAEVVSDAGGDDTYALGEAIRVRLTFAEAVEVDTSGGTPRLKIDMDPANWWGEKWAAYEGGSGTGALTFSYTVVEPNESTRGIAVLADTLEANGGAIRLAATGAAAPLAHGGRGHDPAHKVDWRLAPNAPATGAPAIAGTARVGETLSASASAIADADGLSNAAFAWQWVSVRNGAETDIAGAASSSYRLMASDAGAAIAVRVSFTDDAGNAETLVSEATAPVALVPLTAAFVGLPDEHDGSRRFGFELRFSEEFEGMKLTAVEAALQITNGRLIDVKRTVRGENRSVAVRVRPAGADDMTIVLPATTDCSAATAICARDGRKLSAAVSATIAGPRIPMVAGMMVSSTPAVGDTYGFGETIRVTMSFSEAVAVTGTPRLAIDMDPAHWGTKWAAYESGSGTNALVFAHTVVEPNISTRGIAVLADTLEANGGAIGSAATQAGAELAHGGLDHDPAHKVDWRPTLSVADAEGHEGADEAIEFAVTLSHAATAAVVTVDYATADGTATAGEDYTATSGTLTFQAGESSKTVSVPILDDALDEGRETFLLRLSNPRHARILDGEATGTIENDDPLQKMWLSRFGRTVADHVTSAVADRVSNPLSGAQVTVGGQRLDLTPTEDGAMLTQALTAVARALGAPSGPAPAGDDPDGFGAGTGGFGGSGFPGTSSGAGGTGPGVSGTADAGTAGRLPEGRELLLGSAFHLATDDERSGPGLAAWGRVTTGGFDGEAPADGGNVRIDGNVTTGILGADAEWSRLLAGVAVSVSEGDGTFDQPGVDSGTVQSTMTAVSPYARYMVNDRLSVWGLAGMGTGDMTIVQAANDNQPERVSRTDLEMRLAALGGRGALLESGQAGGLDLALRADAFYVETEAAPISNEGSTVAAASRMRLILEGGRAFALGDGASVRPTLELGLRHDGGDAETGTGVELGGGVAYTDPATGLSVEAKARMLVAHADSDYEEWGVSGAVRLSPGERGRGFSFSLAPTVGATSSAAERLWGARDAGGLAPGGEFEAARGLQGELGYGLGLFGDRFTGTPNLGFGLSDNARDYRLGWRLNSVIPGDPGFEVNLDATRREAANSNEPPEHGLMLRGAIRW